MDLAELHGILYPMARPYEGPEDSFRFAFDGEFEVRFQRQATGRWQYCRFERGRLRESLELPSQDAACEQLLTGVGRRSCPIVAGTALPR